MIFESLINRNSRVEVGLTIWWTYFDISFGLQGGLKEKDFNTKIIYLKFQGNKGANFSKENILTSFEF